MPVCHWCGCHMRVLKQSTSGISGGGGARYKCPNSPHPRCPKCKKTMERLFYWSGSRIVYRDDKWHCPYCEQIAAQAALDIPFTKPPESPWEPKP